MGSEDVVSELLDVYHLLSEYEIIESQCYQSSAMCTSEPFHPRELNLSILCVRPMAY